MTPTVPHDSEPTPEFQERCLSLLRQWESGQLPFNEVNALLEAMGKEAQEVNHRANQGRVQQVLGYIQHYRGNLDASIRHQQNARMFYSQVGNRRRVISMDLNLGESYRFKGDFTRARQNFRSAYESAKQIQDVKTMALAVANEGQLLLTQGHLESAKTALDEGYRIATSIEERDNIMEGLLVEINHARILIYVARGETQPAWAEALEAMERAQATHDQLSIGLAKRATGEVLTALVLENGNTKDDPDDYYRAANEAFQEIKAESEMGRTMYMHALSLAKRGKQMTAARKLQQAVVVFTRLGMMDDAAKAAQAQMEVLAGSKQ